MKILVACALLLLSAGAGAGQAQTLGRDTRWSGEQRFAESVQVPAGITLTIAPGSRIRFSAGGLEVAGRLQAEGAEFDGKGWSGVTLKGSDATTRLRKVTIRGAQTGVLVQGGEPLLEDLVLDGNEVGIELRGKSAAILRDSRFHANRKVGLFVKDDSVASVTGCRFENNGKYGAYIYRASPARFAGNRFDGNPVGLMIGYYGSNPLVEENSIAGNETGIEVDRAARPELRGNRLEGNRTAISLQRRADPKIVGNRFSDNREAIKVAYSSYPRITGNDFAGNGTALKLEFQSSVWEREQGAATRAGEVVVAGAFGGGQGAKTVSESQRRPETLDGTVDARHNWWGDAGSLELARQCEGGNPSFIHDGRDQPTFVEQGQSYPLDRVIFAPWSATPHVREQSK